MYLNQEFQSNNIPKSSKNSQILANLFEQLAPLGIVHFVLWKSSLRHPSTPFHTANSKSSICPYYTTKFHTYPFLSQEHFGHSGSCLTPLSDFKYGVVSYAARDTLPLKREKKHWFSEAAIAEEF
ncbi:hypothetical protein RJT34_16813 [Clitoria ternatea]|uniref:Uncharacterized protein n=1 Tax=Clitoria ternatea TaxID=43366 RepID=A0AAN9J845_CLITE